MSIMVKPGQLWIDTKNPGTLVLILEVLKNSTLPGQREDWCRSVVLGRRESPYFCTDNTPGCVRRDPRRWKLIS